MIHLSNTKEALEHFKYRNLTQKQKNAISKAFEHANRTGVYSLPETFIITVLDKLDVVMSKEKKERPVNNQPILKCDVKGNVLEVFDSVPDASEKLGICPNDINRCLRGSLNEAGGFCWRYRYPKPKYNLI